MLDKPARSQTQAQGTGPRLDLQEHLADLEARGLLVRIDRPINKDTELHPLVRWQFLGGVPEDKRRAFLFTNVVDAKGGRYDMPVVVGALAASPEIYAVGMGRPVEDIGPAWMKAIAQPIAPVVVTSPRCQEVVMVGDALRVAAGGLARLPVPISTPGFDAAPYLTATLCVTRDPESGIQNMGTYRAALKASDRLVARMVAREATGAGGPHLVHVDRELLRTGEHDDGGTADHDRDRHLFAALAVLEPVQEAAGTGRLARHHAHDQPVGRLQRRPVGAHVLDAALGIARHTQRGSQIGRGIEPGSGDRHRQARQPAAGRAQGIARDDDLLAAWRCHHHGRDRLRDRLHPGRADVLDRPSHADRVDFG